MNAIINYTSKERPHQPQEQLPCSTVTSGKMLIRATPPRKRRPLNNNCGPQVDVRCTSSYLQYVTKTASTNPAPHATRTHFRKQITVERKKKPLIAHMCTPLIIAAPDFPVVITSCDATTVYVALVLYLFGWPY